MGLQTKFFTGKGDTGESSVGAKKLLKSDPLIDLLGGVDELNSWLGFCRMAAGNFSGKKIDVPKILKEIQESLFIIQAELAAMGFGIMPGRSAGPNLSEGKTKELENVIREIDMSLPPLKHFVIPGGSELGSRLDVGRALARRVERQAKKYDLENKLSPPILQYLNRLSSILFALARWVNSELGVIEDKPSYK